MTAMRLVPLEDRPREKLQVLGPAALDDAELMAVILGQGRKGENVLSLSHSILKHMKRCSRPLDMEWLLKIPGVGPARACQILALREFSRRFLESGDRIQVRTPRDVLPVLAQLKQSPQEQFVVVTLDGANQVIRVHTVTQGLVNQSQIHPRETFHPAIEDRAVSVIIAHNHPSGSLEASQSDLLATRRLVEVSTLVGIPVMDHLILSPKGFLSLREAHPECFRLPDAGLLRAA